MYFNILLIIFIFYLLKKTESFKQELSADPGIELKEFTKSSFITDDHPENRKANLNKARFRYTQDI